MVRAISRYGLQEGNLTSSPPSPVLQNLQWPSQKSCWWSSKGWPNWGSQGFLADICPFNRFHWAWVQFLLMKTYALFLPLPLQLPSCSEGQLFCFPPKGPFSLLKKSTCKGRKVDYYGLLFFFVSHGKGVLLWEDRTQYMGHQQDGAKQAEGQDYLKLALVFFAYGEMKRKKPFF